MLLPKLEAELDKAISLIHSSVPVSCCRPICHRFGSQKRFRVCIRSACQKEHEWRSGGLVFYRQFYLMDEHKEVFSFPIRSTRKKKVSCVFCYFSRRMVIFICTSVSYSLDRGTQGFFLEYFVLPCLTWPENVQDFALRVSKR